MPAYCSAFGCTNRSTTDSNVSFHRFPIYDEQLLKVWLTKVRRKHFEPNVYSKLCSIHFEEQCFRYESFTGRRILKPDAVPSIFSYSYPPKTKKLNSYQIKFPKDDQLRTKWIMAVRRKDWSPSPFSTLCSRHFTEDMVDRSSSLYVKLRENAVPSIFDYPSNEKEVSQLHVQNDDSKSEKIAADSKAEKTVAAPSSFKHLKKGSMLTDSPLSSANREIALEEKKKLEAQRLAHALRESLENASDDYFHLDFNTGAISNSADIRLSENKRKTEVQNKTVKRKKLDDATSNSPVNPSSKHQIYSNGVLSIAENINSNDKNPVPSSPTLMSQIQVKTEEPWEAGYKISSDTSKNNSVENSKTDNVQITRVVSLSNESNGDIDERNTAKELPEQFDSTFYTKPLDIDGRDKSFGNFIACEISDLHGNPEIYMKTKERIVRILAEAHFEQISLSKKLSDPVLTTKV